MIPASQKREWKERRERTERIPASFFIPVCRRKKIRFLAARKWKEKV